MTEFEVKAYEKLFDSKHHYDNLSWIIGAPVLTIAGGLLAYLPNMKNPDRLTQIGERFLVALFMWMILIGWQSIYQRNRLWAEAANEAIRDFERKYGVQGAGIAFMRATLDKKVVLKNTDHNGELMADPFTEVMQAKSIHHVIPSLAKAVAILIGIVCFLP